MRRADDWLLLAAIALLLAGGAAITFLGLGI